MLIIEGRTLQDRLGRHNFVKEFFMTPIVTIALAYVLSSVFNLATAMFGENHPNDCELVPHKMVITVSPDTLNDKSITQLYICREDF